MRWSGPPWTPKVHGGHHCNSCAVIARRYCARCAAVHGRVTLLAPLYAHDIAHDNPFASNLQGRIKIGNHYRSVMQANTQGLLGRDADRPDLGFLQVLPGG